jgi:hypothetical protein
VCFQDARTYIPDLSERRGFDPAVGLSVLEEIGCMLAAIDRSLYEDFEGLHRPLGLGAMFGFYETCVFNCVGNIGHDVRRAERDG